MFGVGDMLKIEWPKGPRYASVESLCEAFVLHEDGGRPSSSAPAAGPIMRQLRRERKPGESAAKLAGRVELVYEPGDEIAGGLFGSPSDWSAEWVGLEEEG